MRFYYLPFQVMKTILFQSLQTSKSSMKVQRELQIAIKLGTSPPMYFQPMQFVPFQGDNGPSNRETHQHHPFAMQKTPGFDTSSLDR